MNAHETWERLRASGLVDADLPPAPPAGDPWPLRLLQGAGGWLGGLFLLGAVLAGLLGAARSEGVVVFFGLACAGSAIALLRAEGGVVLSQFGFAISIAGQIAVAVGLAALTRDWGWGPALGGAVVSAILLATTPQAVHRWCCAAIAAGMLLSLAEREALLLVTGPATVAMVLLLLTSGASIAYRALTRPIGWGLASAWVVFFAIRLHERRYEHDVDLAAGLLEMAAVLATVALLMRQARAAWQRDWPILAAALVPASLCLVIPGAALPLALLLVAVAERDRVQGTIAVLTLLWLIGAHYQLDRDTPLLARSLGLAAIALAVLGLRVVVLVGGRRLHA